MQNSGNVTFTGFLFHRNTHCGRHTGQMTFWGRSLRQSRCERWNVTRAARTGGFVTCGSVSTGGTVTVSESSVQGVSTDHCAVTIEQSTFDETVVEAQPITVGSASAPFTIENNVIVAKDAGLDAVERLEGPPGSVFRFNTLVNLSGEDETAEPLDCQNSSVEASDNIIAWHTSEAINCPVTYTLVDSVEALPPGTGNQVADASTFFVNMAGKDFHLGSASPALHAAEPGVDVPVDHDGNPRPEPANTNDDVGAFESPE